jgi:hypothetical protein
MLELTYIHFLKEKRKNRMEMFIIVVFALKCGSFEAVRVQERVFDVCLKFNIGLELLISYT